MIPTDGDRARPREAPRLDPVEVRAVKLVNRHKGESHRHDAARPKEFHVHLFAGVVFVECVVEIAVVVHKRGPDPYDDVAQRDAVGRAR